MSRNTAKEQHYLTGGSPIARPRKYIKLPGHMNKQHGPVKIIQAPKSKSKERTEDTV